MRKLFIFFAGAALASACSKAGDRRPIADDSLTRPLEVARVDTTQTVAPVDRHVTPVPEPVAKPKVRKPKPQPRKSTPVAPAEKEDTVSTQGYAPGPRDTALAPDTTTVAAPDTASVSTGDTAAVAADTASVAVPDTVRPAGDTVAASQTDTASAVASELEVGRTPPPEVASTVRSEAARTLPIGTEIHAALDDSINSRTDTTDRVVTAVVMENVTGSDGRTLIVAGAPVRFIVTRLSPARSKSGQGRLALQVDGVGIGGELRKVSADVRPVPHELRGRGVGTSEAAKVGVGAAGGAVLGRVIGGNTKGAVIGGVVGAAGGAVVASQTATRDVFVKARTPVGFVLTQPLVVQ